MAELLVMKVGPAAAFQDAGRPGYGNVGVGVSGAADRKSYELANLLVGNQPDQAVIEITLGGLELQAGADCVVAVTGATCTLRVDGETMPNDQTFEVPAGSTLTVGIATAGLRSYLAVRGGFDVQPVLGSRSWDSMAALGPKPLEVGDRLPIGQAVLTDPQPQEIRKTPISNEPLTVRFLAGPRDEWVYLDGLVDNFWTVSPDSNRVGVRIEGEALVRTPEYAEAELQSEGVARGSIQVPKNGMPVLFLADHPVTGGYPVVGVIVQEDLDLIAQARPGQQINFRWTVPNEY